VRIEGEDFEPINNKYGFSNYLPEKPKFSLRHPLSLKLYEHGLGNYEHYKTYASEVHDHIRKLTLSAFGVTLNSDLSEREYEKAAKMYRDIKGYYLHLYEKEYQIYL